MNSYYHNRASSANFSEELFKTNNEIKCKGKKPKLT